jgi:hypothetical protein
MPTGWFPNGYWVVGHWSQYWPLYGFVLPSSRRWKIMPFGPFRQFSVFRSVV